MRLLHLAQAVGLLGAATVQAACSDNCGRALRGANGASASAFCASFTAGGMYTGTIPAYAGACSSSVPKISSACQCVEPATTTTTPPNNPNPDPTVSNTVTVGA